MATTTNPTTFVVDGTTDKDSSVPAAVSGFSHDPTTSSKIQPNSTTATILTRHSTRFFKPNVRPPRQLVEECLTLAQYSPSSTNFQPWRLTVVYGAPLERLRSDLVTAVTSGLPSVVPPVPEPFRKYRSELGHELYGEHGYGIARHQKEEMREAQLRNYRFFDAPVVAVVGVPKVLNRSLADVFSVGLYIETLVLLLTERGLGSCLQVATAGYPDVIKTSLGTKMSKVAAEHEHKHHAELEEEVDIICTLAIGYEDEEARAKRVNNLIMPRADWKGAVEFLGDDE